MRVSRVQLNNFRNYDFADIRPCDGVTVFFGDNAQGKTNILEAVYLCCTGRSHRTSRDRELIQNGKDEACVNVDAQRADGLHDVEIHLSRTEKRRVKVAGNALSRSGELLGHVTGVLFSPEDLRMVKDGPSERRRFVDMELSQLRPAYYYALQKYARALKQRVAALKEPSLHHTLDMWDRQMAESGARIMEMRRAFIADLSKIAAEKHRFVSGEREHLTVEYCPSIESEATANALTEDIQTALQNARAADVKRLISSCGPHRDDVRLMLNGMDVRAYGSQGQVRTCALSMKLSELDVMRKESGEAPLLMLDDVMSELDPGRRRFLVDILKDVQTLITCTDIDDLAGATAGRVFRVTNARLEEI